MRDVKSLDKNYPLLKVVGNQATSWMNLKQDNDKNVTNQIILEYISLCDVNEGEGNV